MTTTDRYTTRLLRSGATAVIDTEDRNSVALIGTAEEAAEFLGDYDAYMSTCECDLDWNCHLHSNRMYTAIELINDRYASLEGAY